jgi:hypothetical protein
MFGHALTEIVSSGPAASLLGVPSGCFEDAREGGGRRDSCQLRRGKGPPVQSNGSSW